MIEPLFISAFIMGLIGSGHCLVMCGGIASSLQLAASKNRAVSFSIAYNLGRALSYMLAGALVAGISSRFAAQNTTIAEGLSLLSGIFMLLVGIYVMRLAATLQWLEKIGKTLLWQHLVKLNHYILPVDNTPKALLYGAIWGWLPCGLVYSALTWAFTSPSALHGAGIMLFFALGTFPAMLSVGLLSQKMRFFLNHVYTRVILGSVIIWYGIYLLIIAIDKLTH